MEGIRAVGLGTFKLFKLIVIIHYVLLDPQYAMHLVFDNMKNASGRKEDVVWITTGKEKLVNLFKSHDELLGGKKTSTTHSLEWTTTPLPQLLETQAAGLLLNQDTFRRLRLNQVNRINQYLEMLPIDANVSINLRRQLQRMSVSINYRSMRRCQVIRYINS